MSLSLQDQYDKIYRYCYFKVNHVEIAEDLTQETFVKYFSQTTYIDSGKSLAYLYTIAKNLCTDFYRKTVEQSIDEEMISDDVIASFETSLAVKEAVNTLPKELQELVLLRFANELGIGEIASVMGISRFAVYRKLHSALSKLKTVLREEDFS